jgi:hypothetical protein
MRSTVSEGCSLIFDLVFVKYLVMWTSHSRSQWSRTVLYLWNTRVMGSVPTGYVGLYLCILLCCYRPCSGSIPVSPCRQTDRNKNITQDKKNVENTECPTRYRNRHFFNNSNITEDIATKQTHFSSFLKQRTYSCSNFFTIS